MVFGGEDRRKYLLLLSNPGLHRCNFGVALQQEAFLGLYGPRPKRLLAPSLMIIGLGGNPEFVPCTRQSGSQPNHGNKCKWRLHHQVALAIAILVLSTMLTPVQIPGKNRNIHPLCCSTRRSQGEGAMEDVRFELLSARLYMALKRGTSYSFKGYIHGCGSV